MKEKTMTWKEWKVEGFSVVKGEKSCGRNINGECVFNESQVTETLPDMSPEESELYGYDMQHF